MRTVAFVTGTRAEYGLMRRVLAALQAHREIDLKLIATGMHTDAAFGEALGPARPDAVVPWPVPGGNADVARAAATGRVTAELAETYDRLGVDVVLVVGDRVEAFAAATAGHLAGRVVAHVHGGDRALGQMDDTLRHAITRLAHLHLPATQEAARRIIRTGEDPHRVHVVGSPGIDGIATDAAPKAQLEAAVGRLFEPAATLVLHPTRPDAATEQALAGRLLEAVQAHVAGVYLIDPNNDPGHEGIRHAWDDAGRRLAGRVRRFANVERGVFLGLLRESRLLAGNSSSGIIEAASFGTPVLDIGPRQKGRLHGKNVFQCGEDVRAIRRGLARLLSATPGGKAACQNPYGGQGTAETVARLLAEVPLTAGYRAKLIRY